MSADSQPVIAHVLHRLTLAGAEVLAAGLARRLSERYRFLFICLDEAGPMAAQLEADGFTVLSMDRRPGIDWRVSRRLRRVLRGQRIDLLHAHQYTPFFYSSLARLTGRRPRLIFTEHGRHYPDVRNPRRVLANRYLLRATDRVTAVGRFIREALVDNEGIDRSRVEVIYNGIDPEAYATPQGGAARQEARQRMGLPDDAMVVLHVARFHAVKDHATCIRAFARAHDECVEARLVLVGEGELMEQARQLAWNAGIAEHVHFLGLRDDVHALLPGADVFVLSSLSEGISVTLLEAMAARLPIVATHVGGNPEVVEHGRNGLLSPRRDDLAMSHNLCMLLRDAEMRHRMGEAGHNRLLKLFTQKHMHDCYARLYDSMLLR